MTPSDPTALGGHRDQCGRSSASAKRRSFSWSPLPSSVNQWKNSIALPNSVSPRCDLIFALFDIERHAAFLAGNMERRPENTSRTHLVAARQLHKQITQANRPRRIRIVNHPLPRPRLTLGGHFVVSVVGHGMSSRSPCQSCFLLPIACSRSPLTKGADGPQSRDIPADDHGPHSRPWLPRSTGLLRLGPMHHSASISGDKPPN